MKALFILPGEETYLDEAVLRAYLREFGRRNTTLFYTRVSPHYIPKGTWNYNPDKEHKCILKWEEHIQPNLNSYDIIFVSRHSIEPDGGFGHIHDVCKSGVPTVFMDNYGSLYQTNMPSTDFNAYVLELLDKHDNLHYFKRSCPTDIPHKRIYPITFGFDVTRNNRRIPEERDIPILLIGALERGVRGLVISIVNELGGKVVDTLGRFPYDDKEYLDLIARSKIAISCAGASWDCPRHYEIPAQNTLLFIEEPEGLTIPHFYTHKVDAIVFPRTLEGLREQLTYYLQHEEEAIKIKENGYAHVMKWHTTDNLLEFILRRVDFDVG